MTPAGPITLPRRTDPAVAAIVLAWRRLTSPPGARRAGPGARTVIGCSGGADSTALVLALAAAGGDVVVAHVVHDQRAPAQARADSEAVREFAAALDLPFAEGEALVRSQPGNAEARMRTARYAALAQIARDQGALFVATGHHAHDQAESVLMALIRGSGPRGLAGIAPRRRLPGARITLIRPMLAIDPGEARRLCTCAAVPWRDDPTNADVTRLRARVRHTVLPALLAAGPGCAARISTAAATQRDLAAMTRRASATAWSAREPRRDAAGGLIALAWPLAALRGLEPPVLAEVLRRGHRALWRGRGLDRLGSRCLRAAGRAVTAGGIPARLPMAGLELAVFGNTAELRRP